jgi:hypothetical protein
MGAADLIALDTIGKLTVHGHGHTGWCRPCRRFFRVPMPRSASSPRGKQYRASVRRMGRDAWIMAALERWVGRMTARGQSAVVIVLAILVSLVFGWWGAQAKHRRVCEALRRQNESPVSHAGNPRDAAMRMAVAGC